MPSMNDEKKYWRSLDELARNDYFRKHLQEEFPGQETDEDPPSSLSRRRFMQLMGASAALAGMTACRWEDEKILPYAARPDGTEPGKPRHFATMFELGGVAYPLLVTSRDGRPNKIEGNPDHPGVNGASNVYAQALMLELCDPGRSDVLRRRESGGESSPSWTDVATFLADRAKAHRSSKGRGLAIITEHGSSAARQHLRAEINRQMPAVRWIERSPVDRVEELEGSVMAFRQHLRPNYKLAEAKRIVSLDADLFGLHPDALRLSRDWAKNRDPKGEMNRLYAVESGYTSTGASADHRLQLAPSRALDFLLALEKAVGGAKAELGSEAENEFVTALAKDLRAHKGASLVCVGRQLPASVHAVSYRLNETLGAFGKTVEFIQEEAPITASDRQAFKKLVEDMHKGEIETLLVLGGNPAYDAPAELDFEGALAKVEHSVHLSLYDDETSQNCNWHLPKAHELECWGDGLAWDGSRCIQQPLIAPLYDGKSEIEVLAMLLGEAEPKGQKLVRRAHNKRFGDDLKIWRKSLHDGFVPNSKGRVREAKVGKLNVKPMAKPAGGQFELVLTASKAVYDGRFSNNGWLQELPDFLTKMTWDNALLMAKADADGLGVETGSMVKVSRGDRSLDCPVYVMPGQTPGTLELSYGYGRREAGVVGGSVSQGVEAPGFDANQLASVDGNILMVGVEKISGHHVLACTQSHHLIDDIGMEGREERLPDLVREADLEHYEEHPDFAKHQVHHPPLESLWTNPIPQEGQRWGMAIDLNRCVGCNACVIGCQSENNIPVVGKEDVLKGREMHWIRIDAYFRGDVSAPEVVHQPVACHHCESAPCEQVCPVAATVHSHEGLNDMVYNRCVGTRYCANNCPYKVRRFNFFNYHKEMKDPANESMKLVYNPEVTVRARGVMEKCTYCTQRIASARQDARLERRPIEDGDIVTACQQACPSEAIVFGDIGDDKSRVAAWQADPRSYAMLSELNIKPRTQYLARVRNPNPEIARENS